MFRLGFVFLHFVAILLLLFKNKILILMCLSVCFVYIFMFRILIRHAYVMCASSLTIKFVKIKWFYLESMWLAIDDFKFDIFFPFSLTIYKRWCYLICGPKLFLIFYLQLKRGPESVSTIDQYQGYASSTRGQPVVPFILWTLNTLIRCFPPKMSLGEFLIFFKSKNHLHSNFDCLLVTNFQLICYIIIH